MNYHTLSRYCQKIPEKDLHENIVVPIIQGYAIFKYASKNKQIFTKFLVKNSMRRLVGNRTRSALRIRGIRQKEESSDFHIIIIYLILNYIHMYK